MKRASTIPAVLLCAFVAQSVFAQTAPSATTPASGMAGTAQASPFPDDYNQIEPAKWRLIKLSMDLSHGGRCDITLLRPLPWIAFVGAEVGGTIDLVMPEIGVSGKAKVLAIEPCPKIEAPSKPGRRPVIGKFMTTNAKVIELSIEGLGEPIGTTASHPFWSLDRKAWVAAGDLKPGERLRTLDGEATVVSTKARSGTETVYNIEVHQDHTFFVSNANLWVHNTCGRAILPKGVRPEKIEGPWPAATSRDGQVFVHHHHQAAIEAAKKGGVSSQGIKSGWVRLDKEGNIIDIMSME